MNISKKLVKKYAKELDSFKSEDIDRKWILMMGDLANLSESNWDFTSIRYKTVMSLKEWEHFSLHPERIQYKSKIKDLNTSDYVKEVFPFILQLLKDSLQMYNSLPENDFKEELRQMIGTLFDYSLNARYEAESFRIADKYNGRSDQERDNGVIEVTAVQKTRFEYAIFEYCRFKDLDPETVKNELYQICEGRIDILRLYYYTCDMTHEKREMIRSIFAIMRRDQTLAFHNLQLGWEVWKMAREIGLNTDSWLKFIGFRGAEETKQNLLDFLQDKELAEELIRHLEDDLPETHTLFKEIGEIIASEITHEDAKRKQFPKSLKSNEEISQMIKECENEVYSAIPLGKRESARYVILNPTHPAATIRAFQSGTKNIKEELVSVIVMTPRVSPQDKYLRTLAHEVTHAIHKVILNLGEESGVLPQGAAEKVPGGVMEDFSQLVDNKFQTDKSLPYKKKFKGKHFSSFMDGYVTRHQAPYALVQISLREAFDKLWDEGYRDQLTENMMWKFKREFDQKLEEWYSLGMAFRRDDLYATDLFAPYDPDDGLVYLKRYVVKPETQGKSEELRIKNEGGREGLSMGEAFNTRFGDDWIHDKEAKKILYWLLLETGRNHKTETFGEFVMDKDLDECWEELEKIGLNENDL